VDLGFIDLVVAFIEIFHRHIVSPFLNGPFAIGTLSDCECLKPDRQTFSKRSLFSKAGTVRVGVRGRARQQKVFPQKGSPFRFGLF
jgi:hypothetical protein